MAVQVGEGHSSVDRGKGNKMIMVLFSHRIKMQKLFEAWCVKNQVQGNIHQLIAFMEQRGWLNSEKIVDDLKHIEFE